LEHDLLGLTVLDEPTLGCSDPQILRMRLREKYAVIGENESDCYIGFIAGPKALASFVDSYDEITSNRAAPTMAYSYIMPDLGELMQECSEEMGGALESLPLPAADLDLSVEEYTRVICAVLDIRSEAML
jgi:intraflagellar transport protein 46